MEKSLSKLHYSVKYILSQILSELQIKKLVYTFFSLFTETVCDFRLQRVVD